MINQKKTIAAIATPKGMGAIGIIRISGMESTSIVDRIYSTKSLKSVKDAVPYMMYLGNIYSNNIKEKCLMAYFKAPKSYTGEDMIELYCHGGIKLLDSILSLLMESGASPADNGEFTKRAFLNGKMALSDAEGIIDMITAESESAISAGYRLMSGKLALGIKEINNKLLKAISGLEASLDYPDELEEDTRAIARKIIRKTLTSLQELYDTRDKGKIIKYGINVAIIGLPNAGKSSLLNAILQEERAIVSEVAGTTRDTISESIIVDGIKINFIDTAGIRESKDKLEKMGVERTHKAISGADIIINVIDSTTGKKLNCNYNKNIITIYNKCDLVNLSNDKFKVSAKLGYNIEELINKILELKTKNVSENEEILTNLRHIEAIKRAIEYLNRANQEFSKAPSDCILIDLKSAYMALGEIDGSTASEKIIDDIFSRFCVGK